MDDLKNMPDEEAPWIDEGFDARVGVLQAMAELELDVDFGYGASYYEELVEIKAAARVLRSKVRAYLDKKAEVKKRLVGR
jgi:hypothetical protein